MNKMIVVLTMMLVMVALGPGMLNAYEIEMLRPKSTCDPPCAYGQMCIANAKGASCAGNHQDGQKQFHLPKTHVSAYQPSYHVMGKRCAEYACKNEESCLDGFVYGPDITPIILAVCNGKEQTPIQLAHSQVKYSKKIPCGPGKTPCPNGKMCIENAWGAWCATR